MPEWYTEIRRRLAPLRLDPAREHEIVQELAQHLDDRYRSLLAAGQDEATATMAAWQELDDDDRLRQGVAATERSAPLDLPPPGAPARGRWLMALWQDLRSAARTLRKQPAFTVTVLAALALSIGPATAIVSLGNWMFWRPVAGITDPGRVAVVQFARWDSPTAYSPSGVSSLNITDLQRRLTTAAGFAGVQESSTSLMAGDEPPRTIGQALVTGDFFEVLGVSLAAGRPLTRDDDRPPLGAPVVVISHALATAMFESPQAALERALTLNRQRFTVVGVASSGFRGIHTTSVIDVWMTGATSPYLAGNATPRPQNRTDGVFSMFVARLAPQTEFARLEAELPVLTRALADEYPEANKKFLTAVPRVFPGLGLDPTSRARLASVLEVLTAISVVLLLLGCANVANILIARAIRREREVAVRKALGASGWRLVQLQLAESWLMALGGAALGLGLSVVLTRVAHGLLFTMPPGVTTHIPWDWRVLSATAGTALFVGVVAGLAPAWLAVRGRLTGVTAATAASRSTTRAPRLRSALAVLQLALSLALIVGALMLVVTVSNLRGVDLGFDPTNLSIYRPAVRGYDPTRDRQFQRALFESLRPQFSDDGVALAERSPFSSSHGTRVLPPGAAPGKTLSVNSNGIGHNYFDVLKTPILRGRAFTVDEALNGSPSDVAPLILSETLSRRLFGAKDAIGATVHIPATAMGPARDHPVVGIVADSHWTRITGEPDLMLYQPLSQFGGFSTTAIVRSTRAVSDVAAAVRAAAARIDPTLPVNGAIPITIEIERGIREQRLFATMLTWVSVIAFVLAAVGLHGLVSQTAAERTREFGIRMAIGASRGAIARLVARYVFTVAALGTLVGIGLAAAGTRLISALLFGVTAMDPMIFGLAVLILTVVVALAAAWPAFKATRVAPVDVLRAE